MEQMAKRPWRRPRLACGGRRVTSSTSPRRLIPSRTRHKLDLFAEVGTVEVVRGAAAERRYTLRERGWPRRGGVGKPSLPN
ncbi:MAG: hypothetical protein ACO2PN_12830 [Pyrobaculum sp.]